MRRGTTPTITLRVPELKLEDCEEIWATFKQPKNVEITKKKSDKNVEIIGNDMIIQFTQEETLLFKTGIVYAQIRCVTKNGQVLATKIDNLNINQILKDEILIP